MFSLAKDFIETRQLVCQSSVMARLPVALGGSRIPAPLSEQIATSRLCPFGIALGYADMHDVYVDPSGITEMHDVV